MTTNKTIYTNKTYELSGTVECPEGIETLKIEATVDVGGRTIDLRDECSFYVSGCPREDCEDKDGDGYTSGECEGIDCDDNDPGVHPGATESCDEKDNDCNGDIDEDCSEKDC